MSECILRGLAAYPDSGVEYSLFTAYSLSINNDLVLPWLSLILWNVSLYTIGMSPFLAAYPTMEYGFPDPVYPYAKRQEL